MSGFHLIFGLNDENGLPNGKGSNLECQTCMDKPFSSALLAIESNVIAA
jgi:hypothetical protein